MERVPIRYRVVQWCTGNVGKSSLQSIVANPALELAAGESRPRRGRTNRHAAAGCDHHPRRRRAAHPQTGLRGAKKLAHHHHDLDDLSVPRRCRSRAGRSPPSGLGVGRAKLRHLARALVTSGLDRLTQRTGQARE